MNITMVQFYFKERIRQHWTDLVIEIKYYQRLNLKIISNGVQRKYWKSILRQCIRKHIGITRDQQGSLPGTHRGEYSHFYTLKRGTPTSTVSTKTTWVP